MHRIITKGRLTTRRWVFLGLLGALLLLAAAQAAPAPAATNYTGGPAAGDFPLYVANDHSVYAMRFTASGLLDKDGNPLASAGTYYVKVRISPTATPSGGSSRGFTWNPTTQAWVQERADWTEFPVVTTNASGAIVAGTTWTFFKFGDTTKPSPTTSDTWYLVISLQPTDGGTGTTQNNAAPPAVTITDMTGALDPGTFTSAFRIHNGVSATAYNAKRAEADESGALPVWSITRSEPNGVAEGYGTTTTGDFDMAVPVGVAFDTKLQSATTWSPSASPFTGPLADVDIALGGADTTPPAAPATFTVTAGDGRAQLSWAAVADAANYTVFMWQAATPIGGSTNYTPQHLPLATVTGSTTYDATGLTNGETYYFEVRANDAATNVGPPTSVGTVDPKAAAQLTLQTSAKTVNWGGTATLTGALTDGVEPFTAGQTVRVEWSYNDTTWALLQMLDLSAPYAYDVTVKPTRKTMYRLVFEGDATHVAATSLSVTVTPRVKLGTPVAPKTAKKGKKFTVYGSLVPQHPSGSKTVKIKCYQKKSGTWRLRRTVTATNRNYKTYSRYSEKLSLGARGSWKLVASYKATAKYASKTSSARYVKVK
jgi:hypothetical protein